MNTGIAGFSGSCLIVIAKCFKAIVDKTKYEYEICFEDSRSARHTFSYKVTRRTTKLLCLSTALNGFLNSAATKAEIYSGLIMPECHVFNILLDHVGGDIFKAFSMIVKMIW